MGPPSHQPSRGAGPISALLPWGPGTFACQPCARGAAPDGQVLQVSLPPPTTLPSRTVPGSPHDALRLHTHVGVRVRGHACTVLAAKPPPLSPAAQDGHHLSESRSVHTGGPHTAGGPRHAVNGKLGSPPCLRAIGLWSQLGDRRLAFGECLPVHLLVPPEPASPHGSSLPSDHGHPPHAGTQGPRPKSQASPRAHPGRHPQAPRPLHKLLPLPLDSSTAELCSSRSPSVGGHHLSIPLPPPCHPRLSAFPGHSVSPLGPAPHTWLTFNNFLFKDE